MVQCQVSTSFRTVGKAERRWYDEANMELPTDENLLDETDVSDLSPRALGGIRIELRKGDKGRMSDMNEQNFEKQIDIYNARMKALPSSVDQKSWTKYGITHRTG